MKVFTAIVSVFIGCCSNVVFLELLVKEDPGSGNLITFSQFLFIAIEGFIFTMKFGTKKPKGGIWDYALLVVMFFVVNVCNNYAFDFNIPMPLHMIFRAGSLIANMIMGIIILKKVYSFSKYLSVGMITVGIVICTIISSQEVKRTGPVKDDLPVNEAEDFFWWVVVVGMVSPMPGFVSVVGMVSPMPGISLLTVALFLSARMGIYQEVLYKRHGKHPYEALFFTHTLPLPAFAFLYSNIAEHFMMALNSPPLVIPIINFSAPQSIVYLIGDVLSQYMCISSVYVLTTECTSLTVTLVITLRKFVSLLFSLVYFKNPFTVYHWIGTILVFSGTLIFTEVPQKIKSNLIQKGDEKSVKSKKVK